MGRCHSSRPVNNSRPACLRLDIIAKAAHKMGVDSNFDQPGDARMNRKLVIAAYVIAAFALSLQGAIAHGRKHHGDKRLTAVSIGVGAASTAVYFGINDWRTKDWTYNGGLTRFGAWGLTTIGCAALSPIVATLVVNRPLTFREAHSLAASCVLPIIGGWLVNKMYDEHPQWDP